MYTCALLCSSDEHVWSVASPYVEELRYAKGAELIRRDVSGILSVPARLGPALKGIGVAHFGLSARRDNRWRCRAQRLDRPRVDPTQWLRNAERTGESATSRLDEAPERFLVPLPARSER